jgi:LysR family glycine cleavage system transcriptional activator
MATVENLPPLSSLRVFEAAARHLNFTRAAEELGMTQAAVSYQIKLLEERIGAPLFLRQPKQLALTFTGQRLAPGVIEAFDIMRAAVIASRERARTLLSITSVQTFAANWLVHRLGGFQLRYPDIAVKLDINHALVDFAREPFDVGFRSGLGRWPGLDAHMIVRADFTPMLAPSLAEKVREPSDLLKLTLLDPDDPWWTTWFAAAGLRERPAATGPDLKLDSQSLVGSAAMGGAGVAVLTPAFFANELSRGQLVQPFPLVCTRGYGYYLVYPHTRRNSPHIHAFRDWILSEVREPPPADGDIVTPMSG